MNFYLEPYIFAISPKNIEQVTFEEYINSLTEWEEFSKMEWGQIYLLSTTYECLLNNGFYPFTDMLKQLIQQFNITHIGVNDVDRILNQFLNKFPTIDNEIEFPVYEVKNVKAVIDLSARPEVFNRELLNLSSLLSLKVKLNSENSDNNVLFTKDIFGNIVFESEINYMESDNVIKTSVFQNNYSCFESFSNFCKDTNTPLKIWKNAKNKIDFEVAIRISIMLECAYEYISETYKNHSFILQNSVISCIDNLHFQNNYTKVTATIRAIKEVLLNINPSESHWLKIDSGGSSPQIKVNNYCAWRKDIDYEYHLHYWCKSGEYRFADIFSHNCYNITKEFS